LGKPALFADPFWAFMPNEQVTETSAIKTSRTFGIKWIFGHMKGTSYNL
jgi:hypothetical protein